MEIKKRFDLSGEKAVKLLSCFYKTIKTDR
jgi:hypothetical protein